MRKECNNLVAREARLLPNGNFVVGSFLKRTGLHLNLDPYDVCVFRVSFAEAKPNTF